MAASSVGVTSGVFPIPNPKKLAKLPEKVIRPRLSRAPEVVQLYQQIAVLEASNSDMAHAALGQASRLLGLALECLQAQGVTHLVTAAVLSSWV